MNEKDAPAELTLTAGQGDNEWSGVAGRGTPLRCANQY